jgi:hypothetical protein
MRNHGRLSLLYSDLGIYGSGVVEHAPSFRSNVERCDVSVHKKDVLNRLGRPQMELIVIEQQHGILRRESQDQVGRANRVL